MSVIEPTPWTADSTLVLADGRCNDGRSVGGVTADGNTDIQAKNMPTGFVSYVGAGGYNSAVPR